MTSDRRFSAADLAALSTGELVDLYNSLTGKSIKRFSSRAAGLRQVASALSNSLAFPEEEEAAPEAAEAAEAACTACGATHDITPAGLEGTAAEGRNFCHSCSAEWFPDTGKLYRAPKASPGRAAAIARSWTVPAVAAARAARSRVLVRSASGPDVAFSSVPAAFKGLGLPMGRMIAFRLRLKALGTLPFAAFTFTNLPA